MGCFSAYAYFSRKFPRLFAEEKSGENRKNRRICIARVPFATNSFGKRFHLVPSYFIFSAHTIVKDEKRGGAGSYCFARRTKTVMIKPEYATYRYTKKSCEASALSRVECRIPGSEISEILAVRAEVYPQIVPVAINRSITAAELCFPSFMPTATSASAVRNAAWNFLIARRATRQSTNVPAFPHIPRATCPAGATDRSSSPRRSSARISPYIATKKFLIFAAAITSR